MTRPCQFCPKDSKTPCPTTSAITMKAREHKTAIMLTMLVERLSDVATDGLGRTTVGEDWTNWVFVSTLTAVAF